MRKTLWLLLSLLTFTLARGPLPAAGGETGRLEALENMTPEAKEKFYAKKVKEVEGYAQSQIGRYTVYSALGAESSCYWGALLEDFTTGALEEGLFPKKPKKSNLNPPMLYISPNRAAFTGEMARWGIITPKDDTMIWGPYVPKVKAYIIFTSKYTDDERELRTAILREASHLTLYYQVSRNSVPGWFNEGVANNLQTFDPPRRMKANLHYGMFVDWNASHLAELQPSELIPFSRLLNTTNVQWQALTDTIRLNNASGWLALNYLLTTREGRKTYNKMIASYANGTKMPPLAAEKIDAQIRAHWQKTVLPCLKYGRLVFFLLENRLPDVRMAAYVANNLFQGDPELEKLVKEWTGDFQKCGDGIEERAELAHKIQQQMLKEFPDSPEAQLYGAWLDLVRSGNKVKAERAVDSVTKILKANPDFYHPAHNYVLAYAHYLSGTLPRAKEFLAKALRDNRTHPATLQLKKDIQEKEAAPK